MALIGRLYRYYPGTILLTGLHRLLQWSVGIFPFRPNAKQTDMIQTVSSASSEASQGYHCCCADNSLSHLHILNFISSILKCQANIDLLIFVNSMEH